MMTRRMTRRMTTPQVSRSETGIEVRRVALAVASAVGLAARIWSRAAPVAAPEARPLSLDVPGLRADDTLTTLKGRSNVKKPAWKVIAGSGSYGGSLTWVALLPRADQCGQPAHGGGGVWRVSL
jgi:hypothetical protein